jgi:hypothetical protein
MNTPSLLSSCPVSVALWCACIATSLVVFQFRHIRRRFSHWVRRPTIRYRTAETAPWPTFACVGEEFFLRSGPTTPPQRMRVDVLRELCDWADHALRGGAACHDQS